MKILSDIKHINKYILNPYHDVATNFSTKEKWRIAFSALIYDFIILFAIATPISYLIDEHILHIEVNDSYYKETLIILVITSIIIAPVLEEIIFRLPLNFYRNPLIIFDGSKSKIEKFWKKYFKYIFYIFSFAFGILHVSNYKNDQTIFYLLVPIIVLSQGFGGLIIGYIRMHLGFKWAILNHTLFNFTLVLFMLFYHQDVVFEKKNDTIDLTINELNYYEKNDSLSLKLIDNKVISISMNDETIQVLLDTLYNKQYKTVDNHLAKVELTTKEPISKEELLEILKEEYRIEKK